MPDPAASAPVTVPEVARGQLRRNARGAVGKEVGQVTEVSPGHHQFTGAEDSTIPAITTSSEQPARTLASRTDNRVEYRLHHPRRQEVTATPRRNSHAEPCDRRDECVDVVCRGDQQRSVRRDAHGLAGRGEPSCRVGHDNPHWQRF